MMPDTRITAVNSLSEVAADQWDAELFRLGIVDTYFQFEYVASSGKLDGGVPTLLVCENGAGAVVLVVLLREIPDSNYFDIITPYGYGGPVGVGEAPPYVEFDAAFQQWCGERSIISSFVRYHPLYQNVAHPLPGSTIVELAGTVGWRLDPHRDLLLDMHSKHRNVVRKALNAKVHVEICDYNPDLSLFRSLYEETMRRQSAIDYYFFGDDYWASLAGTIGGVVQFDAVSGELPIASALCFGTQPWLHYHLGASTDEARTVGATNLVLYEAARWAQGNGFEMFHLGGGVGGADDSLLSFKKRFDPDGLRACCVGKAIHNPAVYSQLSGGQSTTDGFFPAYRNRS